jgi:ubiquinone/menaquinone biosynthesis C-methylase UbiE
MDDITKYNRQRWKALAEANALFTRPHTNLDAETAEKMVSPNGKLGDLNGKRVLCLAGGGGQQSIAFGLLGAEVTVVDLSDEQLQRDRQMAKQYQLTMTIKQGDMRDLSMLEGDYFDVIFQTYSLNFVPDAAVVFTQVARVIKYGGIYDLMCANPFAAGMTERDWNGDGYTVSRGYVQGEKMSYQDQDWVYDRQKYAEIIPPVEYRQTMSKIINGLTENGFIIKGLQEIMADCASINAQPGTWDHFTAVAPPWLNIQALFRPDVFA